MAVVPVRAGRRRRPTDIIHQVFGRDAEGRVEDEREFVYDLQGGRLVNRSEGAPRTTIPDDSMQSLTCGAVTWP